MKMSRGDHMQMLSIEMAAPREQDAGLLAQSVPDGSWRAWLRVFAFGVICFGTIGTQYAFGLLYVELLADETLAGMTPELAALIGSASFAILLGFGAAVSPLARLIGLRRCCLVGAALSGAGQVASAAATRPVHLFLSFGLVVGAGHSLALFSCVVLMPRWFDSRLSRAFGVANTFSSLAPLLYGVLGPPVFRAIGWRSAMLWLAGLDAIILCASSTLLTPPASSRAGQSAHVTSATSDAPEARSSAREPGGAPARSIRSVAREPRVLALGLAMLVYGLGCWNVMVHIVAIGQERGLAKGDAQRLLVLIALGAAAARIPMAAVADTMGAFRVFLCGLAALALLYVVACLPLARSHAFLVTFAFVQGGLVAGINVITPALPRQLLTDQAAAEVASHSIA